MSAKDRRKAAALRAAVGGASGAAVPTAAKPFGYFDRCYLLNLDRDAERLARVSERLRRLGVAFERFAALGPPQPCPAFAGKPALTPGLFACARSHLAILRRAVQRGEERVLVVEDDAVFRDDAAEWMKRLVPQLEAVRWDVFYLGLHLVKGGGKVAENLGRAESNFHTHAYAVTRRAMPLLVGVIEASMREGFHFDCYEHSELLKVYADPILAVQEPGGSGVLGREVDRLGQYFPPFDREEFMSNCREARGWTGGGGENGKVAGAGGSNGEARGGGRPSPQPSPGVPGEGKEGRAAGGGTKGNGAGAGSGSEGPGVTGAGVGSVSGGERSPGQGPSPRPSPLGTGERGNPCVREAKKLQRGGKLAEAEKLYRQVLAREPAQAEALHYLGLLEQQKGNGAAAVDLLHRSVALRPGSAEFHANLGMVLGRAGRQEEALATLDKAIALGGETAEVQCNRGIALDRLGRSEEAVAAWRRAIHLQPTHAEAHHRLGHKLCQRAGGAEAGGAESGGAGGTAGAGGGAAGSGGLGEGLGHLREAVRLAPRHAEALNDLGIALRKVGDVAAAAAEFRKAAVARPAFAEAHSNLGTALNELGRPDEAVPHLEKAVELRGDFTDAHWNLALALLSRGEFDRGWLEHEWRRRLAADAPLRRDFAQPQWNGCCLSGRTLLVVCEQGLGDTLQFVRYVPLLARRGAKVVLECQASLRELASTADGAVQVVARGEPLPRFDLHVRLMSLPGIFGTRLGNVPADVPYLRPDPDRVRDWKRRLDAAAEAGGGDCLRVGIAWQGNPAFPNDRERSVPLAHFQPLAAVPGVRLLSLQKNFGIEQLPAAREKFAVTDFSPPLDEGCGAFADTAAVMANLDLVVSSDTSMAHLAGALGVRVWLASSYGCDWRWLRDREDSPWYPTMRLFRQPRRGDWPAVFARMAQALRDTLAAPPPRPAEQEPLAAPLSPGDLLDRLGILQIKCERLSDPAKLRAVRAERDALLAARERSLPRGEQVEILDGELRRVNEKLWAIEDEVRLCERSGDFGPRFVELARSVYRTNDKRADLKRQINAVLGSALREEKEYQAYE